MAQEQRDARVAAGMSTAAAIAAALAYINSRRAQPGAELVLPEEFVQLIAAIAASTDTIDGNVQQLIEELAKLAIEVQGWPLNADSISALRVSINPAAGLRMPDMTVPSGMQLVIKAWALNPGWLHVGDSLATCSNVNQSFYLMPSEIVGYQVGNANQIYISALAGGGGAPVAGCFVSLTAEHRKGGG